jgi:hypothetical protein
LWSAVLGDGGRPCDQVDDGGAVIGVAAVAAAASYEHAYALVRPHGEAGWTARLVPLTVDGLIYTSSMVMLDCARRKVAVPALARWLLALGITATLAANVAHGLGHGLTGAAVAAWPAVALVGSYELLMMIIRAAQVPGIGAAPRGEPERTPDADPLQGQAAQAFAAELAAGRVPSVRAIRARLHVGQPRAQRVRAYLAALNGTQAAMSHKHPLPYPGLRRLPDGTARQAARNIRRYGRLYTRPSAADLQRAIDRLSADD